MSDQNAGRRIAGFGLVGVGVLVFGLALLYVLIEWIRVNPRLANLVVSILSVEINFAINRWVTWKDRTEWVPARFPKTAPRWSRLKDWLSRTFSQQFWAHWRRYHLIPAFTVPLGQVIYNLILNLGQPWWVAVAAVQVIITSLRYLGMDRFVFRKEAAPRQPDITGEAPPGIKVSVIIPARNEPAMITFPDGTERTRIHACVDALLNQTYPVHEIIIVTELADPTIPLLNNYIVSGKVRIVPFTRPSNLVGRDTNARRKAGLAAATGDILALTDAKILVPEDWCEKIVRLMAPSELGGQGEVAIAGVTTRMPGDKRLLALMSDEALLSENVRFNATILTKANFGKGTGLPVTACLAFTREVFVTIEGDFPTQGFSGWEDFALSSTIVNAGVTIRTTNEWYNHRMHEVKLRLAKHLVTGMAARQFLIARPNNRFAKNRHRMAVVSTGVILGAVVFAVSAIAYFGWLFGLAMVGALALGGFGTLGVYNALKAGTIKAMVFPILTFIQITVWLVGYWYSAARGGKIPPWLAEFLRGLRLFQL
ncbi:glycosyltransferase [candidate division WWE3 bacterium]|nr:glycosyltransferase [candidate division WWE3 bacterium]